MKVVPPLFLMLALTLGAGGGAAAHQARARTLPAHGSVSGTVVVRTCVGQPRRLVVCPPPRPLRGAVIAFRSARGGVIARGRSGAGGRFRVGLRPGSYTLMPQPRPGLQTPAPLRFTVRAGRPVTGLTVTYAALGGPPP
jgi:hypothetical protein